MRVALVHDWLTGMRGGEKVLEALVRIYPEADIFTLVHVRGSVSAAIESRPIRTSFIQRLPAAASRYRHYLPLFPLAIEQFDLDGYDLVVSSSHCAAKAAVVPGRARHLCYCHSPMRYGWDQFDSYFGPGQVGRIRSRWFYRPVLAGLARWDAATAPRVHRFVANSQFVAARIGRYYHRRAGVVYPPVDTEFFEPDGTGPGATALVVSALVPYKGIDLAIAASAAAGAPLRIVGDGPEFARLRRLAGPDVTFRGWISSEEIREEYRRAGVVLLPGVEDFGIVPVEAQACGTPVVALAEGGALETVVNGVTGTLVPSRSLDAWADAIRTTLDARLPAGPIRTHALRFGRERFAAGLAAEVDQLLASA
jgi:glycosyltransferase involved in cell wall biosynthesis